MSHGTRKHLLNSYRVTGHCSFKNSPNNLGDNVHQLQVDRKCGKEIWHTAVFDSKFSEFSRLIADINTLRERRFMARNCYIFSFRKCNNATQSFSRNSLFLLDTLDAAPSGLFCEVQNFQTGMMGLPTLLQDLSKTTFPLTQWVE